MAGAETGQNLGSGSGLPCLIERLRDRGHLVLAVSGGSDSIALMWLARGWLEHGGSGTSFTVLTVDHGLRPESAYEADKVASWACQAGFAHHILQWCGTKPGSGVQDAARTARYSLMSDWCRSQGARGIVTAHTLDDQAETFLMRLGRGSGLDGLSGMAAEIETPWHILRPLLDVDRQTLKDWLLAHGRRWIDDPSNEDMRFERVRVRKALEHLAAVGIATSSLGVSAQRLMRSRQALDFLADEFWSCAVGSDEAGKLLIARQQFDAAPSDLRLRILDRAIRETGEVKLTKLAAMERLESWVSSPNGARARTLGGCRVSLRKRHIVVSREPGRRR